MAVDAKTIKDLRDKTGMGISDCKKALEESGGDLEQAELLLRKRQQEKAIKKADRPTGQGVIAVKAAGGKAVILEVACEQEPTTGNERFKKFVALAADVALATDADSAEALLNAKAGAGTLRDELTSLAGTVGENVQLKRAALVTAPAGGILGSYVHFNHKAGAVVALKLDGAKADHAPLATAANDVCMHAVAMRPVSLDRSGIPAAVVAKEKEVYMEEVKSKPAQIQEKILEGKLSKFYSEKVLMEQVFVKAEDGKQTVREFVAAAGKAAGGKAELCAFKRFELGLE